MIFQKVDDKHRKTTGSKFFELAAYISVSWLIILKKVLDL